MISTSLSINFLILFYSLNPPKSRINLNFLRPVIPQEDQSQYIETIEDAVKSIEDTLAKDFDKDLTERFKKRVYQVNHKPKEEKQKPKKWVPHTTRVILPLYITLNSFLTIYFFSL